MPKRSALAKAKWKKKKGSRKKVFKKKVCPLCVGKIAEIDFKEADKLSRFTTEKGKIIPRRISGACAKHQRGIAKAIKRARVACLMPFKSD